MKHIALLLTCMAFTVQGASAELFRWVDDAGRVHYSDTPPTDASRVERKKVSRNVEPGAEISYEARRAQENFPVTLYVTNSCGGPCEQARGLLSKRGIPFSEKILNTQEEVDSFFKLSGSSGAPTLAVGNTFLSGFLEQKWNSELDIAGYPKTATYRQRIAPPPATPPKAEEQPTEEGEDAVEEDVAEPAD